MTEKHLNFDKLTYWAENYGRGDVEDKRNVENFVICETDEMIRPFLVQLHTVSQGHYDQATLDTIVGQKRRAKHGSYEEWAKLMMLWVQEARKKV